MNIKWNSEKYTEDFDFVHKYGESVMDLMGVEDKSFVVDLGCGNGALTKKLSERGFEVLGIDPSIDMINIAKNAHKDLNFKLDDALEFKLSKKADAIFSNAVMHWIDAENQEKAIENIASQLKIGGEFVCEFGGKGCAELVHSALEKSFNKRGLIYPRVFYFPTIGQYSPLLEKYGLRVEYAVLFDRPTPQKTENGLEDWVKMFVRKPFENIDSDTEKEIIEEVVIDLKDELYIKDTWFIDYVRIRIKARKIA